MCKYIHYVNDKILVKYVKTVKKAELIQATTKNCILIPPDLFSS